MTLKILTVDDSKTIRMIVKKAFKPFDCELFEAENGVEGLSIATREKPDLIVLDVTMPVMNGIEMLGKLKSEPSLKDIPVIMLTAESGKDNVIQILKMGVKDYIVKPFKGEQLIERAQKIVKLEPRKKGEAGKDPATEYFTADGDIQILSLPEKITKPVILGVEESLQAKIKTMENSDGKKIILDLRKIIEINVLLIKLLLSIIQQCQKANISVRVVGTPSISEGLKGFQETSAIKVNNSIEEAKAAT